MGLVLSLTLSSVQVSQSSPVLFSFSSCAQMQQRQPHIPWSLTLKSLHTWAPGVLISWHTPSTTRLRKAGHAEHPPAPNQAGFGRLHSPQLGCPCGPARCRPHRARGVPPVQRGALGSGRRGCPDLTSLGWPAYALSEQNRTHSLGTGRKPWPHCRLLGDLGQIRSPL